MRSIIDEIVYQSCTCFQMEYVIMGYLKVADVVEQSDQKLQQQKSQLESDDLQHPQVRLKGSLAINTSPEYSDSKIESKTEQEIELYFCAINFNLRKFAMIKMTPSTKNEVNSEEETKEAMRYEASSQIEQFSFIDLQTVTSVHQTNHARRRTMSQDKAAQLVNQKKCNNNLQLSNQSTQKAATSNVEESIAQSWPNQLNLKTKDRTIQLYISTKKEKQLWLTEFSRAIEWADGATPVKAGGKKHHNKMSLLTAGQTGTDSQNIIGASQGSKPPSKNELIAREIEQMEPAIVEGLSIPPQQFFCYKNFMTGLVRVKVSNFESILKTKHNYPIQKLKLVLKAQGSNLYLDGDKQSKSGKTQLGILTLEKVNLEIQQQSQNQSQQTQEDIPQQTQNQNANNNTRCSASQENKNGGADKRKTSFGRLLLNKMIGAKSPKNTNEDEISTQFAFSLKTEQKTYTLFTSSLIEAETWVRILSLICEMNRRGLSVDQVNPFDYEKYKATKILAEKQQQKQMAQQQLQQQKEQNHTSLLNQACTSAAALPLQNQSLNNNETELTNPVTSADRQPDKIVQSNNQPPPPTTCQIQITGISADTADANVVQQTGGNVNLGTNSTIQQFEQNTAAAIVNTESSTNTNKNNAVVVQQQPSQQSIVKSVGGTRNAMATTSGVGSGGPALKLENCKVGQIVIQVSDQSQLAQMGISLNQNGSSEHQQQHQTTASQVFTTPKQQGVHIHPQQNNNGNLLLGVPNSSNQLHATTLNSTSNQNHHNLGNTQQTVQIYPTNQTHDQNQQQIQKQSINTLSSSTMAPDGGQNVRNIVRNFRKNQLSSAMRKKQKYKLLQLQQQVQQVQSSSEDASAIIKNQQHQSQYQEAAMVAGSSVDEDTVVNADDSYSPCLGGVKRNSVVDRRPPSHMVISKRVSGNNKNANHPNPAKNSTSCFGQAEILSTSHASNFQQLLLAQHQQYYQLKSSMTQDRSVFSKLTFATTNNLKDNKNEEEGASKQDEQSQNQKRPRSSLMLKGTNKRIFKKKKNSTTVSVLAATAQADELPDNKHQETKTNHLNKQVLSGSGCLIIPKRNIQRAVITSTDHNNQSQHIKDDEKLGSDEVDYQGLTSEDILRRSGCSERQRQDLKQLNSGLPVFMTKHPQAVVFNPAITSQSHQLKLNSNQVDWSYSEPQTNNGETGCQLTPAAIVHQNHPPHQNLLQSSQNSGIYSSAAKRDYMVASSAPMHHTSSLQSPAIQNNSACQPQYTVDGKSSSIGNSSANGKILLMKQCGGNQNQSQLDFEQIIENQRDLNFLDKLIAQGDHLYGGSSSVLGAQRGGNTTAVNASSATNSRKQDVQASNSPDMRNQNHRHYQKLSRNKTKPMSQSAKNQQFTSYQRNYHQQNHPQHAFVSSPYSNTVQATVPETEKEGLHQQHLQTASFGGHGAQQNPIYKRHFHQNKMVPVQSCEVSDWDEDSADEKEEVKHDASNKEKEMLEIRKSQNRLLIGCRTQDRSSAQKQHHDSSSFAQSQQDYSCSQAASPTPTLNNNKRKTRLQQNFPQNILLEEENEKYGPPEQTQYDQQTLKQDNQFVVGRSTTSSRNKTPAFYTTTNRQRRNSNLNRADQEQQNHSEEKEEGEGDGEFIEPPSIVVEDFESTWD